MPTKKKTQAKKSTPNKKENKSALFIPAGILLGMGMGFVFNNLPAWMFIGLGAGMVVFAILNVIEK